MKAGNKSKIDNTLMVDQDEERLKKRAMRFASNGTKNTPMERSYVRNITSLTTNSLSFNLRDELTLQKAFKHNLSVYHKSNDYHYICDQLKGIRQELTIQNMTSSFALQVYQTHARLAILHKDIHEFGQCIHLVFELFHKGEYWYKIQQFWFDSYEPCSEDSISIEPSVENLYCVFEFMQFKILFLIYNDHQLELGKFLQELPLCWCSSNITAVKEKLRKKRKLKLMEHRTREHVLHSNSSELNFALEVLSALNTGNYARFFTLQEKAPKKLTRVIMEWIFEERVKKVLIDLRVAYEEFQQSDSE